MTKKIYKTARGKTVDMGALVLQNEKTRAVGNMNVNARGDRIDAEGNVIDEKGRRIQRQIQRQTNVSQFEPPQRKAPVQETAPVVAEEIEEALATIDTPDDVVEPLGNPPKQELPATGLAGALAKAKKSKSETTTEE